MKNIGKCFIFAALFIDARVAELVDAPDSNSGSFESVGSTPTPGTFLFSLFRFLLRVIYKCRSVPFPTI